MDFLLQLFLDYYILSGKVDVRLTEVEARSNIQHIDKNRWDTFRNSKLM